MDKDVSRWILEFLLRQPIPDHVLSKAFSVLPLPNQDSRFKKTLLLRSIQGQTKAVSALSETVLENLEILEELDHLSGVAVIDSMRVAYCAVAVCCTLEYVGDGEDTEGKYFSAVKRLWRRKVDKMEGISGLFSDELAKCRDDIEAALLDEDARRNLLKKKMNCGEHALCSVKSYLEEAWAIMGPPFLEVAAKAMMRKQGSSMGSEQANTTASEHDLTRDDGGRVELGAQTVNQTIVQGLRDHQVPNKVGERVESLHESGQDLQGDDSVRDEVAPQLVNQEVHGSGNQQVAVADNVVPEVASLHGSGQGSGGSEGDRIELPAKATNPEQVQGLGSKQVGEASGKKVAKSHRKKHTAHRRLVGRRAEIVDAEDSGSDLSCIRNDPLPSPEVRQVQEALKTSNKELQAMVTDPLPDALKVSDTVRSELEKKHMNDRPSPEVRQVQEALKTSNKELQAMVTDPLPDALKVSETVRSELEKKHMNDRPSGESIPDTERTDEANMVSQKNAARPGWLERNSTARTYEWDESIDSDSSEGTSKVNKRLRLPSPKRVDCSPLKNGSDPKIYKRRKVKRWSILEEDTLRTGVHLYGKGNWKLILTKYSDIFEERTDCDLKDKWRNMTRYEPKA